MDLTNRTTLVTGASRGIGREIALGFARAGAHVVLAARDKERLAAVAAEIEQLPGTSEVVTLDVSDANAVRQVIDGVVARHGRLGRALQQRRGEHRTRAGGRGPRPKRSPACRQ